ncbi:hypothetical protein [Cyclobacterium xiamenense]|uniref:hypothetical protein n=1 Tax=Cyclobacterium xiamenense TaxID=1297121 RepID=UPI0012B99BC6|nr:hypothetical protein [Cyclobacterium xiamenense]
MKNLILYVSISMILLFCTSKPTQHIFLFNDVSFKLNEDEEVADIDPKNKEIFNLFYDKKPVQIPLFRCIQSDDYLIFIGIPFNTSIKELANHGFTSTFNQTVSKSDSTSYIYKKYSIEQEQITSYTKSFDTNLVYILTVSNSADLSDSLFSINALSNRFKK